MDFQSHISALEKMSSEENEPDYLTTEDAPTDLTKLATESTAIYGPRGCGKSAAIKAILEHRRRYCSDASVYVFHGSENVDSFYSKLLPWIPKSNIPVVPNFDFNISTFNMMLARDNCDLKNCTLVIDDCLIKPSVMLERLIRNGVYILVCSQAAVILPCSNVLVHPTVCGRVKERLWHEYLYKFFRWSEKFDAACQNTALFDSKRAGKFWWLTDLQRETSELNIIHFNLNGDQHYIRQVLVGLLPDSL